MRPSASSKCPRHIAEKKNFNLLILLPSLVEYSNYCIKRQMKLLANCCASAAPHESSRTETAVLRTRGKCCAPAATAVLLLCKAASATTCRALCSQHQRMHPCVSRRQHTSAYADYLPSTLRPAAADVSSGLTNGPLSAT